MDVQTISSNVHHARILIVDDHPDTADTLARTISQLDLGVEVLSATSGKMALEQARQKDIDLLITDMMMPEMNGLELIEKLRSSPSGRSAYTILVTAYDVPGLQESARRLKVNETIIKPFRPERFCQIVVKALEQIEQPKIPQALSPVKQPSKILIVDDLTDNITLLSRYMKSEGYDFISANNGVEALEKVRSEMPDLIILDISMPGKDGLEVLREIRADPAIEFIPVILLTAARIGPFDMQSGLNLGADDYITKPFDRQELLARIRTRLRAKEAEKAIRRRYKELSVLPEIGKDISARLDINELTNVVLRRSVETLGAALGQIVILNARDPLIKRYHIPTPTGPLFGTQYFPVDDLLERVKANQQGLIINDFRKDPLWRTTPASPTGSAIIVPLIGRFDLIGMMVLIHENVGYFKAEHQLLLQAIASQAAIALENAQLHAKIARERQRLTAVLQSAADAILMFDTNGSLALLNPAGEKMFARSDTKLGLPFPRGRGYDALIDLLEKTRSSKTPQSGEIVWPDHRVFSVLCTPIEDGGNVVLMHDVSHFKTLERVRNEFISNASHDLKNPITSIALSSQLIAKAGPLNDKQSGYVDYIHSAAETMTGLVQSLLEQARADLGMEIKREPVDMNAQATETVDEFRLLAEAKKQALHLKLAKERPLVLGDPLQLRQTLGNLVGNAIKYTPAKGSIELSVEILGNQVVICVTDTGEGILPDDLPFIFDRFYRGRNGNGHDDESDGIGLAIVKAIVERHSGKINVVSSPGKGSCFTITLPLSH